MMGMANKGSAATGPLVAGLLIAAAGWLWLGPLLGLLAGFGVTVVLLLVSLAQRSGAQ